MIVASVLYLVGLPLASITIDSVVGRRDWEWWHYVYMIGWPLMGVILLAETFYVYFTERF